MQHVKKGKHKHRKHKKKKSTLERIRIPLLIILAVILLVNVIITVTLNAKVSEKMGEMKESAEPAFIELFVLKDSKCDECFDIDAVVENIKNANVNITEEKTFEFDSDEGKNLLEEYGIEKIPTVIVTGEIDKLNIGGLDEKEDALVFTNLEPPYVDSGTGDIVGRVTVTYILEPSCDVCDDPHRLVAQLKSDGVSVFKENDVNSDSKYGRELIRKYNITKLPAIIFSEDLAAYSDITENWYLVGSMEDDGNLVVRTAVAIGLPYYDVEEGKVRGLVDIVYLADKSCEECYDVAVHNTILTRSYGVKFSSEKTVDITDEEGKTLIEKYNITSVPTMVMLSEADVYTSLKQVWAGVGTVEEDGTYVFRNNAAMTGSVYKDLSTGEILGK